MPRFPRWILLMPLALLAAEAAAYTVGVERPNGPIRRRPDAGALQFSLDPGISPDLTNAGGRRIFAAGSDPIAALRAAADSWNAIREAQIGILPFRALAATAGPRRDGINVISFADTAAARSLVDDAVAVTSFFVTGNGNIVESDIVFNPDLAAEDGAEAAFSTTGAPGAFDIQSIAAHEMGHALGARHSSVGGATMWQNSRPGETFNRELAVDDRMFAAAMYPSPAAAGLARIRGVARFENGAPIRGGMATAAGPSGATVSAIADLATGAYEIVVPPGEYFVYLDPANGPLDEDGLNLPAAFLDRSFHTTLAGGAADLRTIVAGAGDVATVDFFAPAGDPPLEVRFVGVRESAASIVVGDGPRELGPDEPLELFLWGPGLADVRQADILALGPNVELVDGSVRVSPGIVFEGFPALRATVRATSGGQGASLGTLFFSSGGRVAAYTGGLVVAQPPAAPRFSANSVTNAASFLVGPVTAGGLISIFGERLGPAGGAANTGFGPNGRLATSLGGVEVEFDGIPAPLFFVSAGQINAQTPFEVAGRTTTRLRVAFGGGRSEEVELPVAEAAPGVFFLAPNAPAILNQSGALNVPSTPARRGQALVVFATGIGATSPGAATGAPAPGDSLAAIDPALVEARLGGVAAPVLFAGLAPGFVGLAQINLVIPEGAPLGDSVPLELRVRGRAAQSGVPVAIAP